VVPPFFVVVKIQIFVFTGVFTIFEFEFFYFFDFRQISAFLQISADLICFLLVYTNILEQKRIAGQA
jgi:hypothetical protein